MTHAADRVIVVGAGLAGVVTALELAPLPVLLIAPRTADEATRFAQGGIAVAMGADDAPHLHAADTHAAGAGLCDADIVAKVTEEGPRIVERLLAWGVAFDREADGAIALGLEAAHGRSRILHAGGDATGRSVLDTLIARARSAPHLERRADLTAVRLKVLDGCVAGLWCRDEDGALVLVRGRAVVLATGGLGGLYASTTNPLSAVGSGLAMAARAGAVLRDLEFVQFHPTAIATTSDPMPLATEALRGAGAVLVNDEGARVMAGTAGGDLAPRDVVARAIHRQIVAGRKVFLDARDAVGADFPRAFPSVYALCRRSGIDPEREAIPVRPAAHYHMGGVKVDGVGRTSLPGLYACGEVASTGLHGANRLASNSLLEALAFAHWIAADVRASTAIAAAGDGRAPPLPAPVESTTLLRRAMDRHAGVVRDAEGLFAVVRQYAPRIATDDAALLAALIAAAALSREESRGGHFRSDFPATDAAPRHSEFTLNDALRRFPSLSDASLKEAV
ncbi:L-aspartate oxidase [Aquabacter sp. CN5-332]|uniref:L-aspartate oxidase n=1 Tax=Aquabacter sp. CN5-332 TaxID=3156608 RepID=UPI0032B32A37